MASTLRLFGHPALERDGIVTAVSTRPKVLALLALLVAGHGSPIARERLARTLWRDGELDEARGILRRYLYQLRETLGERALLVSRNSVQWNVASDVHVDVIAFERAIEQNPQAAVELYRGDFCQGVDEDALNSHRIRYRTLCERALDSLIASAQRGARYSDAIRWAKRALVLDPLNERHVRVLMQARERLGDVSGALQEYRALSARLKTELDVPPEPETTAIFDRLARAANVEAPPANLPPQPASFVGREDELAELTRLAQPQHVVSITGTGGIGKTRMACRFAADNATRYSSGLWLVPVEPGDTVSALWRRLAAAANINAAGDTREHVLREFQTGQRIVIFDACEHALQAARDIIETLRKRTNAHLIATTRRRLALECETAIELSPLQAPERGHAHDPQALLRYPAYRLFVERAVTANPSFRAPADAGTIVALLGKLDALPLAIELTAARLRHFSPIALLERYGSSGVPLKLDQTIASSYEALGHEERKVFCALSVFHGSFSLPAIESLYDTPVDRALGELTDASLLQVVPAQEQTRYRLLDVLRNFAAERLQNEADLRERHARYYARLASTYQTHFRSPEEIEYFRRADADAENFNATLRWATQHDVRLAAQLARSLAHYVVFRWDFAAVEDTFARLGTAAGTLPAPERGALLLASGLIAKAKVDNKRAEKDLREAREIFREHGDATEEAEALFALAVVVFNANRLEDALALFEELLAMRRAAHDDYGSAQTLLNMAATLDLLGFAERAQSLQTQALRQFERLNFRRGIAYAYRALAVTYAHLHNLQGAIEAARASVAIFETLDDTRWLADALTTLANQLTEAGRWGEAAPPLARALQLLTSAPDPRASRDACLSMLDVTAGLGLTSQAALAYGKAAALGREHGLFTGEAYETYLRPIVARVQAQLGEDGFRALCTQGGSMSIEDLLHTLNAAIENLGLR